MEEMKPRNLVMSFIGACLPWVGRFGFNAGSALSASGIGQQRVRGYALRSCRGLIWMGIR
jgi:ammonia channel protein AmtB